MTSAKRERDANDHSKALHYKTIDTAVAQDAFGRYCGCPVATACRGFYNNVLLSSCVTLVQDCGAGVELKELALTPYYKTLIASHLMPALNLAIDWICVVGCVPVFFEHVINVLSGSRVSVPLVPSLSSVNLQVAQRGQSTESENSAQASAPIKKRKSKEKGEGRVVSNGQAHDRHYRVHWKEQSGLFSGSALRADSTLDEEDAQENCESMVVANFSGILSPDEHGRLRTPIVLCGVPQWRTMDAVESLWMQQLELAANPLVLIEQNQMSAPDRNAHDLAQLGLSASERLDRTQLTAEHPDAYSGAFVVGDGEASELAFSSSGVNMLKVDIGTKRKAAIPDGYKLAHVSNVPSTLDVHRERQRHICTISRLMNLPPGLLFSSDVGGGGASAQHNSSFDELTSRIANAAVDDIKHTLEHVATCVLRKCITLDILRSCESTHKGDSGTDAATCAFEGVVEGKTMEELETILGQLYAKLPSFSFLSNADAMSLLEHEVVDKDETRAKIMTGEAK
jgi:hypothetical protein